MNMGNVAKKRVQTVVRSQYPIRYMRNGYTSSMLAGDRVLCVAAVCDIHYLISTLSNSAFIQGGSEKIHISQCCVLVSTWTKHDQRRRRRLTTLSIIKAVIDRKQPMPRTRKAPVKFFRLSARFGWLLLGSLMHFSGFLQYSLSYLAISPDSITRRILQ